VASYVLAHDLGTTGNKATLYDAEGRLVGRAFHGYATAFPHPRWAEQDPEDWWQAVCGSTRRLLQETRIPPKEIGCIAFSGQMMGCVPLDRQGRPLRRAIIWADQRALEQTRWLAERIGPEEIYRITGHRLSPSYSLEKILWLRDHEPDVFRETHKFVHAKDAMVARLTGAFVTDPSDASGMNLFDLDRWTWSSAILDAAELPPERLPSVQPSAQVVGHVTPQVAPEVGVAPGTPVVIGGGDGACASAGAGAVAEGMTYNYVGSSAWIGLASSTPLRDPEQRTFTFCHVVPGMFLPMGTMQAAGASYQWARDHLCPLEVEAGERLQISPYELMNLEAERVPPGAGQLLFLPYLMGERSPWWNPRARGAFVGLTIRHTRAELIRAVLEGITLNLRLILDTLRSQQAAIQAMRVIGGGGASRLWNQLMADIYGLPVQRLAVLEEATSMGAALVGGVAVGLYPGFEMAEQMNPVVHTLQPDPEARACYEQLYPLFQAAYQALEPIFAELGALEERHAPERAPT